MEFASKDVLFSIAMGLDLPDILRWCRSNSRVNNVVCNNPNVWRNKLLRDYPDYEKFNLERSLKETYVFMYQLSLIKDLLNSNESLYDIFLSKNLYLPPGLKKIPAFDLPNLQLFYLVDSHLTKIPAFNLPNLKELYLSHNQLTEVPSFNLPYLRRLYLGYNQLTEVPSFNLPNLEDLYLSSNQLTAVPSFDLPNLKILELHKNKLTKVPPFNLPNLKKLTLENNHLTKLPEWNLPNIEMILLYNNDLTEEEKIKIKDKYKNTDVEIVI